MSECAGFVYLRAKFQILKMWSLPLWILWCIFTVAAPATSIEDRYNFFNIDLLQRVNEDVEGNLILSPSSAKVALMTLVEGTGGRTHQELLAALRLPPQEHIIRRIARLTLMSLKNYQNGTESDVATRVWINPSLMASENYMNALRNHYGTDIRQINFSNANDAANAINTWVREQTRDNINSIIQPDILNANTQLLVTSALYFKGQWLKSFNKHATRMQCFHVPTYGCQDVPMMENIDKYRYGYIAALDSNVVEIPYSVKFDSYVIDKLLHESNSVELNYSTSNGRTSMLIFLPSHEESDPYLRVLSKDLSYVPMRTLLNSLNEAELILVIPRFSIENKLDLRSPLMRMGVLDIFTAAANFTGIEHENYLQLENIIQNAKIEVNEEGTIAAAITQFTVVPLIGSTTPTFLANRPFMFAIIDIGTSETLFIGRFMGPAANNSRNV